MAEKQETKPKAETAETTEKPPAGKRKLLLIGGAVAVVALGGMAAMMAVPKSKIVEHMLGGPWVTKLSKGDIQVNLMGEGSKRYLSMALNAEYFAYDESYVTKRIGLEAAGGEGHAESAPDLLFTAMLQDALLEVAATRTRDQVTDSVQIEAFLEEMRSAVDPLLFPVCIGDSHMQNLPDTKSGVRAGESIMHSTMRGLLHEHHLMVDAHKKTLRLDEGTVVEFRGNERDLRVDNEQHQCVFVDVTRLEPEFVGEIPCGVAGKVQRIYRERFLVQ